MRKVPCPACGEDYTPKTKRQIACGCDATIAAVRRAIQDGADPRDYLRAGTSSDANGTPTGASGGTVLSSETTANVGSNDVRFVLWPDTHFPNHDPRAIALGLEVVRYHKPDIIFLLGDMLDGTGFGKFARSLTDKNTFLATEIDHWKGFAERLNEISPKSTKFFIEGNHEARFERWLWANPQLTDMDDLTLNRLMRLREFGYEGGKMVIECELANGELTFTHGTHAGSNKAGFGARFEMARFGTSGGSGHTHRLATYMERSKSRLRVWVEAGHMSQHQPHYLKTLPNWQQGMVIGQASASGNDFEMETVPFRLTYRCRLHGKELSA